MFRKLLNVGKGHSSSSNEKLLQQQQQQKNLFQLNEIKSYGFSHLCCLGYSPSLSLLAVGSKQGLLKVLGNSSVEFNYQLESCNSIRQIEFIDCRKEPTTAGAKSNTNKQSAQASAKTEDTTKQTRNTSAQIVVLTDNGQLHLFELKTFKQQNFADNTTQTEGTATAECQLPNNQQQCCEQSSQVSLPEFTKLEKSAQLDYFKYKPDDEDRSRRITTLEISSNGSLVYVGTEGGDLYQVPLDKFVSVETIQQEQVQDDERKSYKVETIQEEPAKTDDTSFSANADVPATLSVELETEDVTSKAEAEEPFEVIKFDDNVFAKLGDDVKSKKQGAIESIKRFPASTANGGNNSNKILISYHRGLSVIYDVLTKSLDKYFYHNQVLESSCFADQTGNYFYTSHNDGSYIKWNARHGSQAKANEDFIGQLYGPYPCKPTPKIQACTGLVNDQLEDLVIFSGGMPRATYDDKNPVTIVKAEADGKDSIKTVLDFTSKVLDFVIITRPRGNLGAGAKSTGGGGGGGKKNRHKQQQQKEQQRNQPIAVALAILAEEEFAVIDLLNSENYLEFPLPYLNCVHSTAITCNQHYSEISDELYENLLAHNKQQLKGKLSTNEWPITGGQVIEAPELRSHDILLTGHEDGSVHFWDVSDLSMRHLLHLPTSRFFSTSDDDLVPIDVPASDKKETSDQDGSANNSNPAASNNGNLETQDSSSAWPPLKRVGKFDPYSDDTRLAIRKLSLCPQTGTLVVAGTGGQVLVFELKEESNELHELVADEITIVNDQRFTWKGREKLSQRAGGHKFSPGYQLTSYVQLDPPVAPTSLDLRSDWRLYALGTSYGFYLYDYSNKQSIINKCTLNVQDFAIVSGDATGAGAISRKKSFRKSLRESFRRLRRGRSQRQAGVGDQPPTVAKTAFSRVTTGVRTLNAPSSGGDSESNSNTMMGTHRAVTYSTERQVEQKVELSSIVKCLNLTSAIITSNSSFKPTLWVGTNSGQVLVYAINLASEQQKSEAQADQQQSTADQQESGVAASSSITAKLVKEIQLRHKAPIIAIFTSPEAPPQNQQSTAAASGDSEVMEPVEKQVSELLTPATDYKTTESQEAAKSTQNEANDQVSTDEARVTSSPNQQQQQDTKSSPSKQSMKEKEAVMQPRVLICSEEQFKVFNLPNLKPFCKFKLTAHEGLRAKKISITQFLKPAISNKQQSSSLSGSKSLQSFATQTSPPSSPVPPATENEKDSTSANGADNNKQIESNNNSLSTLNNNHTTSGAKDLMNAKFGAKNSASGSIQASSEQKQELGDQQQQHQADSSLFEPYMVCMSNQGDCAIYSVPDLKRQAQIQVCKREDVNGITSAMLTNYGEGYYLRSSSNFLRFSISTQRVLRVLSVV